MNVWLNLAAFVTAIFAVVAVDFLTGHALLKWLKEIVKESPESWRAMLIAAIFLLGMAWMVKQTIAEVCRDFLQHTTRSEADLSSKKDGKSHEK
jgi:ethanolamine transporter EutH